MRDRRVDDCDVDASIPEANRATSRASRRQPSFAGLFVSNAESTRGRRGIGVNTLYLSMSYVAALNLILVNSRLSSNHWRLLVRGSASLHIQLVFSSSTLGRLLHLNSSALSARARLQLPLQPAERASSLQGQTPALEARSASTISRAIQQHASLPPAHHRQLVAPLTSSAPSSPTEELNARSTHHPPPRARLRCSPRSSRSLSP